MKSRFQTLANLMAFSMMLAASTFSLASDKNLERGRYLVAVGGCNDCHTAGFAEALGAIDENLRLLGSPVGFSGPWGVTYAGNLRLAAQRMTLNQWLQRVSNPGLPPMPWPSLLAMTHDDKIAVYTYLKSLGPAGVESPANQPPGIPIQTLHIPFVPQPAEQASTQEVSSSALKH